MKNYFITFEGIDGSGKDTQLFALAKAIKDGLLPNFGTKYDNIWITREPTMMTAPGKFISKLIKKPTVTKEDASNGFVKDRIAHTKYIKRFLKHSHVLCSRYDISTLTYQMTQGMDFNKLYKMHKYNKDDGVIIPDITLIFDLPVKVAWGRINKRDGKKVEVYENLKFLNALVKNQKDCISKLKQSGRKIIVINANNNIEAITKEMIKKISKAVL